MCRKAAIMPSSCCPANLRRAAAGVLSKARLYVCIIGMMAVGSGVGNPLQLTQLEAAGGDGETVGPAADNAMPALSNDAPG